MSKNNDFLSQINIEEHKNQNLDEYQLKNEMIDQVNGGSNLVVIDLDSLEIVGTICTQ